MKKDFRERGSPGREKSRTAFSLWQNILIGFSCRKRVCQREKFFFPGRIFLGENALLLDVFPGWKEFSSSLCTEKQKRPQKGSSFSREKGMAVMLHSQRIDRKEMLLRKDSLDICPKLRQNPPVRKEFWEEGMMWRSGKGGCRQESGKISDRRIQNPRMKTQRTG